MTLLTEIQSANTVIATFFDLILLTFPSSELYLEMSCILTSKNAEEEAECGEGLNIYNLHFNLSHTANQGLCLQQDLKCIA